MEIHRASFHPRLKRCALCIRSLGFALLVSDSVAVSCGSCAAVKKMYTTSVYSKLQSAVLTKLMANQRWHLDLHRRQQIRILPPHPSPAALAGRPAWT